MDDLLKPIKSVKTVQGNIEKFETLSLRESRPTKKDTQPLSRGSTQSKGSILELDVTEAEEPFIQTSKIQKTIQSPAISTLKDNNKQKRNHRDSAIFIQQSYLKGDTPPSLSDNAREILRCQPSHEDLLAVLQYLQFGIEGRHDLNIRITSPKSAQIINVLVTVTIPDTWIALKQKELSEDEARMKKIIILGLSSPAGIGALLAQIKHLSSTATSSDVLEDTISVLENVLRGNKVVFDYLTAAPKLYNKDIDRRLFWQQILPLLAGGRVLSVVAQAFSTVKSSNKSLELYVWLTDGAQFTHWLAKNVVEAATKLNAVDEESWKYLGEFVKRGMSLGHRDKLVSEIYTRLLLGSRALWTPMHLIINQLSPSEQKSFFDSILSDLALKYFQPTGGSIVSNLDDPIMRKSIAGAAALVAGLVKKNEGLEDHVVAWLVGDHKSSAVAGLLSRRALITTFGHSEEKLQEILEKSLAKFGDKLQIQHAAIIEQEAIAQVILLTIGYLNRINVSILKQPSISTLVMHAVSNRLAASIPQPRLLGMIVGTAISKFVDKQENVIDFGVEEMETESVKNWLDLVSIYDSIGDISDIRVTNAVASQPHRVRKQHQILPKSVKAEKAQVSKIIAIEELSETSESEDDDLVPYQKPDSDAEDSEEDPTLINRSKPSAPVYIIDLIKQLQSNGKPDIVELALRTAPSLIRRKMGFGTELSDNIQTLTTILINLQEGMSEVDLQEIRVDCLIACVAARPEIIGPSLADLYFRGDFSLSQRIALLTAVGLGARDMAGFNQSNKNSEINAFPSKRLPAHLEPKPQPAISATRNPIAMLTDTAAQMYIRPMALEAADQATGPSVLKIRTFSSRMEVEKKNQEKTAARTKNIPKNLYKILTEALYLPLCTRMSLLLSHTLGGRHANTTVLHSSTLRLYLQTLTLILHTLGPSASLHLPTITHETLILLLNLQSASHLSTDPAILPALLHLLLALIEITIEAGVTAQERLITNHGPQIAELVNWSSSLGDKISVPNTESEEDSMPWTVLAAGIQVKWFEMGRRFQGRMLGLSVDEMDQLAGA